MEQSTYPERIFSVSEFIDFLNEYLKPARVVIQGEIGEKMSVYPNYTFFNLRDKEGESTIQCFALAYTMRVLGVKLEPGMEVRVHGYASVFKKNGGLNVRVEQIELVGEGMLKKQFEILKKQLTEQGLFDNSRKRAITKFPERIGLITSKEGRGAFKDFHTNLAKIGMQIHFYPVRVEGIVAVGNIIEAFTWFNRQMSDLDALVLIRGGGSWESLQAFNSEEVVRAIVASKIPVISGIGHEDDLVLSDLAADIRASTPTHAARILSEGWMRSHDFMLRAERYIQSQMSNKIRLVHDAFSRFVIDIPKKIISEIELVRAHIIQPIFVASQRMMSMKQDLVHYGETIRVYMNNVVSKYIVAMSHFERAYSLASPALKLKQGYSIVRNKNGKIIKTTHDTVVGDEVMMQLANGSIDATITEIDVRNLNN